MNNFISTFEELNKLYEEAEAPKVEKKVKKPEEVVEESCVKEELTEAAEDEEIEIVDDEANIEEIPDDGLVEEEPVEEDEPRQVIIECSKCGALVIKDEADIVSDEESDLVNIEDPCEYCEEEEGYKIVGVVTPYEAAEEIVAEETPIEEVGEEEFVEEGLLDIKTPATIAADII